MSKIKTLLVYGTNRFRIEIAVDESEKNEQVKYSELFDALEKLHDFLAEKRDIYPSEEFNIK